MKVVIIFSLIQVTLLLCVTNYCQSHSYTPSDDASWAIHSNRLSTLLTSDKQAIYDNYIDQCNKAAVEDQKREGRPRDTRFCTYNDGFRMRMNREQPSSVYNYTTLGYEKIKTPSQLFQLIQEFYHTNKHQASVEWPTVNTYQNLWEFPSTIVRLEDPVLKGGGVKLKEKVLQHAQNLLEEWVGQKLSPVSLYGVRQYHRGSILAPHVDRMPLITSAIINVDQQGMEEPWVLEVYGHDGQATNITMEVGDMVFYESHSVIHGRPFPLQGDLYANVFVHFEPSDTSLYNPKVGLPPYIIPGSIWEASWREENPNGWMSIPHDKVGTTTQPVAAKHAIWRGDIDLLRQLGEDDPEALHEVDENGWHPLHEAVRAGNIEIVQILLDHGADINQETDYDQNPLTLAIHYHGRDHPITDFLLAMGAIELGPDL